MFVDAVSVFIVCQSTGPELMKLKDRRGGSYCLAPTHEETITSLVAETLHSHKQLPLLLYQLDRKFRDEARPRSGLIRAREFWMKDLYTFDVDLPSAERTYAAVCSAYDRIFARLSVPVIKAQADTGNIGGVSSHEYHVLTPIGEDTLLLCEACGYAANSEKASGMIPSKPFALPYNDACTLAQQTEESQTGRANLKVVRGTVNNTM